MDRIHLQHKQLPVYNMGCVRGLSEEYEQRRIVDVDRYKVCCITTKLTDDATLCNYHLVALESPPKICCVPCGARDTEVLSPVLDM